MNGLARACGTCGPRAPIGVSGSWNWGAVAGCRGCGCWVGRARTGDGLKFWGDADADADVERGGDAEV